jgi:hypothetical protein
MARIIGMIHYGLSEYKAGLQVHPIQQTVRSINNTRKEDYNYITPISIMLILFLFQHTDVGCIAYISEILSVSIFKAKRLQWLLMFHLNQKEWLISVCTISISTGHWRTVPSH